jgi:hypothetical protein
MKNNEARPDHPIVHCLKAWPAPFAAVRDGSKRFEHRNNDRKYRVGDVLVLQEYNPDTSKFTGEAVAMRVTYILPGGKCCVKDGYCVLSIAPLGPLAP